MTPRMYAGLQPDCSSNPPSRETTFPLAWQWNLFNLSSADLMVHTAPMLPASPLSRIIIRHNTNSQKVTKPNYLKGQR